MSKKLNYLVCFVVPVLSLISNAQAGEATADTFVRGAGNGDTNYGSNSNVTIKNSNGNSYDRKGYIRFDIAGATAEASLDLTVATNNQGGGGTTPQTFTIEVFGLAESLDHTWTENDITWNNAPGNDTSSSNFTADATLLGSFIVEPLPVGNIVSFSDPALVDFINSDTDNQITLLFRRTTGNSSHNVAFAAKENTSGYSPPTLNAGVATQASGPSPAKEATDVPRDVVLSWTQGELAAPTNGHKVYFGESFDDVNDATGAVAQTAASYTPAQRLDFSTTYYWRVDEVNAPPTSHIEFKGDVWSFTTEPVAYSIANVTATASSSLPDMGPENTVNGLGMDADDLLHSVNQIDMWVSGSEPNGAWIEFEFDRVYKLHEMFVWNSNQAIEPIVGFGAKGVTIEYSVDGTSYTTLGTTHEFARAPGAPGYAHNTTIDFGGAAAKNVRLMISSNWGFLPQYSLSEVRFTYIPVLAREPQPQSGTTDMDVDVTLSFRAGREAATHDVYNGTDRRAVIDGTADVTTVTEASHGPLPLDLGRTYYWKVNEVNDAETPTMWEGDIWRFRTQEYFVVDGFEDYNDYPGYRIYETWADGWEIPTNGALLGYPEPINYAAGDHILETTDIHGGEQSLPFFYDNSTAASSEASVSTADLAIGRDWSKNGAEILSLWFKGISGAFLEAPAGTFTMTASGADIWNTADEFRYAFKQLSGDGSIIAKVESVEYTDGWAKCGVMIRETLEPGSKFAAVYITPGNGCRFQARLETGIGAISDSGVTTLQNITAPHWVKLERDTAGNFNAYNSYDGVTWTPLAWNPQNIPMVQNVYIGLALTSHNASAVCAAKFSNVQTTGAVSPQTWSQQAIGVDMPTVAANPADQMYVALSNSGGLPAAVYHDFPNATQVGGWTKWDIELQKFADKGIDLNNVDKFYIGIGDKNNLQADGSGMMLFDDAYLYPLPAPSIGLVVYYPFDEVIGATITDASGNGYDGTVVGVPTFVAGKVGQAISLGGEDDYVEIPDYNGVTGIQSRTCCAWIKTTKSDAEIVSWGQNVAGQKWIFRTQTNNGTEGAIRVEVNGGYIVGDSDMRDDNWHYVAAVFETDETPDVTDVKLYVDGVQETISAQQSRAIDTAIDGRVIIGKSPWGNRGFEGLIDDVRIYDYALSVVEVLELAGK